MSMEESVSCSVWTPSRWAPSAVASVSTSFRLAVGLLAVSVCGARPEPVEPAFGRAQGEPAPQPEEVLLDVPYVAQGLTLWCGLAAQCMLLRYYGIEKHLWAAAKDNGYGPREGISGAPIWADGKSWDEIEAHMGRSGLRVEWYQWSHLPPFRPSSEEVWAWVHPRIAARHPVAMFLTFPVKHAIVLTGCAYDGRWHVYVHDPSGAVTSTFLDSKTGTGSAGMHVRLKWEALFGIANSPGGIVPQRLMAVVGSAPNPRLGTLYLGRGSQLVGTAVSGFTAVFMETKDSGMRAELKMDRGLRWGLTRSGGSDLPAESRPPASWPAPGTKLVLPGAVNNLSFALLANGGRRPVRANVRLALLDSRQLGGSLEAQADNGLRIPARGTVGTGLLELDLTDVPSGTYVPVIALMFPDAPDRNHHVLLPAIRVGTGMLDVVLCIDKSGSMIDDIKAVQETVGATFAALDEFARSSSISLQAGLVTYTRHDEPGWLHADRLAADVDTIRRYVNSINITDKGVGRSGNEDMYGALMYAMNQTVGGERIDMGWRPGAAKIIMPMGDEPPDDPDWEGRTLTDVARVAFDLDPVHVYPLLLPKQGAAWLDPAARAMEQVARATNGRLIRVRSASELPQTLVDTVKLAVRRHREEVWRKQNPPYVLYAVGLAIGFVVLATIGALVVRQLRAGRSQAAA